MTPINDIKRNVQGSAGKTYDVTYTVSNDEWACPCMSFVYSKNIPKECKHITRVKLEVLNESFE